MDVVVVFAVVFYTGGTAAVLRKDGVVKGSNLVVSLSADRSL